MSVIALIPARLGSKGIPGKNFRLLGDRTLVQHTIACAQAVGCDVAVSTDYKGFIDLQGDYYSIHRPSDLAQDDTPMSAVVQHALQQIPGQPDDIIVLLQPTQPFRTPGHIQQAIALLQESGADSVVSVVPLPLTHSPSMVGTIGHDGYFWSWDEFRPWPSRRQDATPAYRRDGTVYAFRRKTVAMGSIYGEYIKPLVLDPSESCELDTEADWADCVRRWEATHG